MKKYRLFSLLSIFVALFLCMTSCVKEEDDYVKHPTATSTIIEGRVSTPDGAPIAGLEVGFDYVKTVWLAGMVTRHKAKCRTDKDGYFRMFFEIKADEKNEPSDGGVSKHYDLTLDLKRLPADDYIMPSDINPEWESTRLSFYYGNDLKPAETYRQSIEIPRKRMVDVVVPTVENIGPGDEFAIHNHIKYGGDRIPDGSYVEDGWVCMTHTIDLKVGKEAVYSFPCAVDCENRLSLRVLKGGSGSYEPIRETETVTVTSTAPESIVLVGE